METLDEKRDEILNSSVSCMTNIVKRFLSLFFLCFKDKYLDVNDHFQFIRLTDSLRRKSTLKLTNSIFEIDELLGPVLTFLEWFNAPQSTVVAGEKLQTFSAAGDEGSTDRVRLEEKRTR